ncbi:MAG: pyridoxamine 5'-phosphate oxidase family protein [Bacillota bacterium]
MDEMRRKDRRLSEEDAMAILLNGEYGVLSTVGGDGTPYGVPVSYAVGEGKIYIHGTAEGGKKARNIEGNPKVCLTVVGKTEVLPEKFSTKYESAIVFGTAALSQTPEAGLQLLMDKYSSRFKETGMKYLQKAMPETAVYEICIEKITGKARR